MPNIVFFYLTQDLAEDKQDKFDTPLPITMIQAAHNTDEEIIQTIICKIIEKQKPLLSLGHPPPATFATSDMKEDNMEICVRDMTGQFFIVFIKPDDTVLQLKERLIEAITEGPLTETDLKPARLQIVYGGRVLNEENQVTDYPGFVNSYKGEGRIIIRPLNLTTSTSSSREILPASTSSSSSSQVQATSSPEPAPIKALKECKLIFSISNGASALNSPPSVIVSVYREGQDSWTPDPELIQGLKERGVPAARSTSNYGYGVIECGQTCFTCYGDKEKGYGGCYWTLPEGVTQEAAAACIKALSGRTIDEISAIWNARKQNFIELIKNYPQILANIERGKTPAERAYTRGAVVGLGLFKIDRMIPAAVAETVGIFLSRKDGSNCASTCSSAATAAAKKK